MSNWYARNTSIDDSVVQIAKPVPGSINGGGFLVNQQSAGRYAGDVGARTNFGLNVKFNKSMKSLQGNANIIFRSQGRVYQIKSNSTQSLNLSTISPGVFSATFTSKSSLTDITDPLAPIFAGRQQTPADSDDRQRRTRSQRHDFDQSDR